MKCAALHTLQCFVVRLTALCPAVYINYQQIEKEKTEEKNAYDIFFLSCCCCCCCCYFITPARHLVHNTQRSYTQSLCSLTLNHSIAYPVLKTLFVHLHTNTHAHTHQCFILNLPLWLLLFLHCVVDDFIVVAGAAGWGLCILLH